MTRRDVQNAGHAWRRANPDERTAGSRLPWPVQLGEALDYLNGLEFHIQKLQVPVPNKEDSVGVVFGYPDRIMKLRRRGHLTLMDSTHCTNALGWYLYTLMVRDEYGSWIPSAHLLSAWEDSEVLAEALCKVKAWCLGGWTLRYMLTDDSAAEQAAVKKAFRGLEAGEQEVDHLLCRVHSNRTLQ